MTSFTKQSQPCHPVINQNHHTLPQVPFCQENNKHPVLAVVAIGVPNAANIVQLTTVGPSLHSTWKNGTSKSNTSPLKVMNMTPWNHSTISFKGVSHWPQPAPTFSLISQFYTRILILTITSFPVLTMRYMRQLTSSFSV